MLGSGAATRAVLGIMLGLGVCVAASSGRPQVARGSDVVEALVAYRGGNDSPLRDLLAAGRFARPDDFNTFERAARRLVSGDSRPIATLAIATAALEIAHTLRDRPADWPGEYLAWASRLMRSVGPRLPHETERLWYLACLAGMEELDEPWALAAGIGTGSSALQPSVSAVGTGGLLDEATRRFPQEARFDLQRVEAAEWLQAESDAVPDYLELARQNVAAKAPLDPRNPAEATAAEVHDTAAQSLLRLKALPEIDRQFGTLFAQPSTRAEALLHSGVLQWRLGASARALQNLRDAFSSAPSPYVRYLASYYAGRVLVSSSTRSQSIAAFEGALRQVPQGRASAYWLSTLLFLSDASPERDRAFPLFQDALAWSREDDPAEWYGHGDAWNRGAYLVKLRMELQ